MNQVQIGKFIAELRKEKKMTQTELGEKIGVTNKTVSRWENGNYMPDISIIPLLCDELEIGINELISGRRLSDADYKQNADHNLMITFNQIKKIKRDKSIIDSLTGAGTGLLVSCLWAPATLSRIVISLIGLTMIGIGWYLKSQYDRFVIKQLEDLCD